MSGRITFLKVSDLIDKVRKAISILLIAVMLGMSNAILEENRTLNDTRNYSVEQELPAYDDEFDR